MTRSGLAKYSTSFIAMVVAGYFLGTWLDQHFAPDDTGYELASTDVVTAAACGGEDGNWRNWPKPNIPDLSPRCSDDS